MRPAISLSSKHTNLGPLLEVEMSKKCTPLWREAHLEVKSVKNWRVPSIFGSWDVEKMHALAAQSTFRSQNVQNTSASDHFWRVRCWKSGVNYISKSEMLKKSKQHIKTPHVRATFGRWSVVLCGRHKGSCTLAKVSKRWCFPAFLKTNCGHGTFEEDLQRWISRGRPQEV